MTIVEVHAARTHFSQLLKRVAQGEEVVIAKAGKPVARLVPIEPAVEPRRPGSARGLGRVAGNFDAPMPEGFLAACTIAIPTDSTPGPIQTAGQ